MNNSNRYKAKKKACLCTIANKSAVRFYSEAALIAMHRASRFFAHKLRATAAYCGHYIAAAFGAAKTETFIFRIFAYNRIFSV